MLARRNANHALSTFRFRGCLFSNTISASTASGRPLIPATADDKALVELFNERPSSRHKSLFSFSSTGLFGHPGLTNPRALISLANVTVARAHKLTDRILASRESKQELAKVVKRLDRLSDMLCGVIDLAELVRNAHPDRAWVAAANNAYESMCEFMNVLNTNVGLYEVLGAVLADPDIVSTLGPEAHKTALIFWNDFEKSGIHLPPASRSKFVSLSSEILVLGRQFLDNASTHRPSVNVKHSELAGLKRDQGMGVRLENQARFSDLVVYPHSLQAQLIMTSAPNEGVRRRLYTASNSSTPEEVAILDSLLKKRGELAQLVGAQSYGHMTLDDKMARSPENVNHFLNTLLENTNPSVKSALHALSLRKQQHLQLNTAPVIQAWDRDFYCPPEPPTPPISLPPLTLGTVFMALSRLFRHLYGVTLRPVEALPGEVWTKGTQKLEVVDESTGVIGWIYTDLYSRRGKAGGAAHYTVRCSRRTDNDQDAQELNEEESWAFRESLEFEAVKRHRLPGQDGIYQLPLVVLLCDFGLPGSAVLEWHQVITLFHEMGHAMHSMLGRTEYQNVSGTRCATDFVELPSILMEHFLTSPAVLSLFDVNTTHTTNQTGNHHEDPCHSIDTQGQIVLALLDQLYHSGVVLENKGFNSTNEIEKVYRRHSLVPFVHGTSFQTQFGHLYGYGATYYSYLFDRAIASRVWGNVFVGDPLKRETGERYKNEVLRYGGGKDPWTMLAQFLKTPHLEGGDAEAMKEVGRWKIEDDISPGGRH